MVVWPFVQVYLKGHSYGIMDISKAINDTSQVEAIVRNVIDQLGHASTLYEDLTCNPGNSRSIEIHRYTLYIYYYFLACKPEIEICLNVV